MPSVYQLPSGKWRATANLPGGKRRSSTFPRRSEAHRWGHETEAMARQLAAHPELTLSWSPAGLHIDIPDDLLTMDTAKRIEDALNGILGKR